MASRKIGTATVEVKADTRSFRTAMSGLGGHLRGAVGKLSGAIAGLGLGHLAREALEFGAEYRVQLDNARAAVDGLTDSEGEANKLMREMTDFAIRTPFDLPGVQDATTRLLAFGKGFGVTTDNVIDYVQIMGDAAASTGKGTDAMNNVVTTFGKISGQGRVLRRDMNQLVANFPSLHPWELLAEHTGMTVENLQRMSLKPGGLESIISGDEAVRVFLDGLQQMPGAADAMERRMHTLGGTMELFKDTMGVALADGLMPFFASLQGLMTDPAIKIGLNGLIGAFSTLASRIMKDLGPVMPDLIQGFKFILIALMPLTPIIGKLAGYFAKLMIKASPLIDELIDLAAVLFDALGPSFDEIVKLVGVLADEFGPVLEEMAPLIREMAAAWGDHLGEIMVSLTPLLIALAEALIALLPILTPLIALAVRFMTLALIPMQVTALLLTLALNLLAIVFEKLEGPVTKALNAILKFVSGVQDFVNDVIKFFQDLFDKLVGHSIIPDLVNSIIGWFQKLFDFVKRIVDNIKQWITNAWNAIKNVTSAIWRGIVTVVTGVWNTIKQTVINGVNAVRSFLSGAWERIRSIASSAWNGIKNAITNAINSARDFARNAVQNIRDKVHSAWSGLSGWVSGVWNSVKNAITGPIQSAYNFVADKVGAIKNLVTGAIGRLNDLAHTGGGLNPLNWFASGGIFNGPQIVGVGEKGPEAIIPLTNPMRAMQLMHQAGLDRLAASMQGSQRFTGPLVSMPNATIQDATDADLVAQRTLVAMQAAMVA